MVEVKNDIAAIESFELLEQGHRVELSVRIHGSLERIYFASEKTPLVLAPEAALAAVLIPGMSHASTLLFKTSISPLFLKNLPTIMNIYSAWWPESVKRIAIQGLAPATGDTTRENQRVGCFFSAGVDSFYSFFKHQDEITDLILIHGFDYQADRPEVRDRVAVAIQAVAAAAGKNVIEIETNLGHVLRARCRWVVANGTMLAAIGYLLSGILGRIYVPAAVSYAELVPGSTHPLLDPLWSTESLTFIHDGCEATRFEKTELLTQQALAKDHLRVCWYSSDSIYNCGKCQKCVRTMLSLMICGALEQFHTFPEGLRRQDLAWVRISAYHRCYFDELLRKMEERGIDPGLQRALRKAIHRPKWIWEWHQELRHPQRMVQNLCRRLARPFAE